MGPEGKQTATGLAVGGQFRGARDPCLSPWHEDSPPLLSGLHDLGDHRHPHPRPQPLDHLACTLPSVPHLSIVTPPLAQPRAPAQPQTTYDLGWRGPTTPPEPPRDGTEETVFRSLSLTPDAGLLALHGRGRGAPSSRHDHLREEETEGKAPG